MDGETENTHGASGEDETQGMRPMLRYMLQHMIEVLRLDYGNSLAKCDLTHEASLKQVHQLFDMNLQRAKCEFLLKCGHPGGASDDDAKLLGAAMPKYRWRDIAAGVLVAAGAGAAAGLIGVPTTSWWIFTKTQSIAAIIGGAFGIPAVVAGAGVACVAGLVTFCALSSSLRGPRSEKMFQALTNAFDRYTADELRAWGEARIAEVVR